MPFRPKNSRFWHYDFQIRGRRFHGSCGTEDYEEAKAVEAQARVSAKGQANAPKGIFTLSEALGTYWTDVAQHQPSARTTESQAKNLIAGLGEKTTLDKLKDADVLAHVSRRRATVANGTVNREIQLLGRALRHMAKFHQAVVAPLNLKDVETAEPKERIRELSAEEQDRLFKHLRADLHPMVKFALMTGARRATICGLRWSDVDLNTSRIRFRVKGGKIQHFPINNELRAFLSSLPRAQTPAAAKFVLTYVNEETAERLPISPNGGGIHGDFKQAVLASEIEDFRFHDLRHTFATRILRKTGNLKLVSRLLGHADISTTMRYAHVLDSDLADGISDYLVMGIVPASEGSANNGTNRESAS